MYTWPRDGLIPAAAAVLESLWAYVWITFLLAAGASTSNSRYPYAWILALLLVPAVIGRFLDRSYWGPKWVRQYGLSAIVVGLFAGFMVPYHAAGAAWLAAGALLARGVWLALGNIGSDAAAAWFLAGFSAFLGLLAVGLVAHVASWNPDRPLVGPLMAVYLFGGLSWLALVRRQEMEERAFRRPSQELNGTWLLLLAAISGGMIGLGALVSFGASGVARGVVQMAVLVAGFIWRAAIFAAVNWLGPAVLWLFSVLHVGGEGSLLAKLFFGRRPPSDIDARLLAWLRTHLPIEVVVALAGGILMALVAVWLAMRIAARDPGADDEERMSLWSWRGIWQQLLRWLSGVRRAFLSARPAAAASAKAEISVPLSSVRQLYTAVLRWCREHEHPREPAETPLEFQPVLEEQLDGELGRDVTLTYLHARYAEVEVPEGEVRALRERWESRASPDHSPSA